MHRIVCALVALVLTTAFVSPMEANSTHQRIRIVFAIPQGEELTIAEQVLGIDAVVAAASFWERKHPASPQLPVDRDSILHIPAPSDVYTNPAWAYNYVTLNDEETFVIIIDNSATGKQLGGHSQGWASYVVYALITGIAGTPTLPALIAHELGHLVFNLSDLRAPFASPSARDIMGASVWAFRDDVIGCPSLANLGFPCRKLYIPVV